eukprot:scaffold17867_cov146-Skeletonema_marinoi.AAC.4
MSTLLVGAELPEATGDLLRQIQSYWFDGANIITRLRRRSFKIKRPIHNDSGTLTRARMH